MNLNKCQAGSTTPAQVESTTSQTQDCDSVTADSSQEKDKRSDMKKKSKKEKKEKKNKKEKKEKREKKEKKRKREPEESKSKGQVAGEGEISKKSKTESNPEILKDIKDKVLPADSESSVDEDARDRPEQLSD